MSLQQSFNQIIGNVALVSAISQRNKNQQASSIRAEQIANKRVALTEAAQSKTKLNESKVDYYNAKTQQVLNAMKDQRSKRRTPVNLRKRLEQASQAEVDELYARKKV